MKTFANKTVVITGSSRGIGLALVKKFANAGANIIACSSCYSEERDAMYKRIACENNVEIFPVYFDMSDEDSVKEGIYQIKELKQNIDVLINNAGISLIKTILFTKMEDLHKVFQVNYFSTYLLTQGLVKFMKGSEGKSIINMASVAGIDGGVGVSAYGASKASIILLTKVMAHEFAPLKIRVNAVAPGMVDTDMANKMGPAAIENMTKVSASGRMAKPEEIADTVYFLASNDASYINGEIIRIDGGKNF